MIKHAKLSASGSSRWLNCPGSVKAEEPYPDTFSPFAEEGSMAHDLAEQCLKQERDADSFIGVAVRGKTVEKEMADYVQEYLDYVRSFITSESCELTVEQRVDFSNVVPNGFGTLDACVVQPLENTVHIFDLKYGKGVAVSSYQNSQALLYAIGIQNELNLFTPVDKFVLHIVQPRIYNNSSWEVTKDELLEFENDVRVKAKLALSDDAKRVPGEKQCQWCKAKGDCVDLAKFIEKTITKEFDNLEELDVETLTMEQKRTIMQNRSLIEGFIKSVEASIFDTLQMGEEVEGFKLVEGRTIRRWSDNAEKYLAEALGDKAYSRKLIGIGEAEKLLGKGEVADFTVKPEGKPTLAFASDKRQAIETNIEKSFDSL